MKTTLTFLLISLGVYLQAQIVAGNNVNYLPSGGLLDIMYPDYQPITYAIDIDIDGTEDFVLSVGSPCYDTYCYGSRVQILNPDFQINISPDNYAMLYVSRYDSGQVINNSGIWTNSGTYAFRETLAPMYLPSDTFHLGFWLDSASLNDFGDINQISGYMGFRECSPSDTSYGWLYIYSQVFASAASIFFLEYGFEDITDIRKNEHEIKFNLYPNPSKEVIFIEGDLWRNAKSAVIVDINGNTVQQISTAKDQFYIGNLTKGIYLLRINSGNNYYIERFIKN